MKKHTTRKYINQIYGDVLYSIPYCDAQTLLHYVDPFAYNSGVYGWNCDYYFVSDVVICTGYRPHGRASATLKAITKEYELKARELCNNFNLNYDEKICKLDQLRIEWIKALKSA